MLHNYNINQTTLKILLLYSNNYRKSLHLREIARETRVDVKAIQLQVKKLESANILSHTVKGRNKEYSLNLNNLTTRYLLIMAETYCSLQYLQGNFVIRKLVGELGSLVDGIVLLFGSFAKGRATRESDIDIFVITDKQIDRRAVLRAGDLIGKDLAIKASTRNQFERGMSRRDPLVSEVVSSHVVLKGVDEFCDIMWRYYLERH
jgi:predicted nucleotidyltransferase